MNLNVSKKSRERLIEMVNNKEYFHHLVVKAAIVELHKREVNLKSMI